MIIAAPEQIQMPLPVRRSNVVPLGVRTCQFPLNDGPIGRWLFCESTDMRPGSSYCRKHHARCYRVVELGEAAD